MRWWAGMVVAAVTRGALAADGDLSPLQVSAQPLQVSVQIDHEARDLIIFTDGPHLWMPVAPLCEQRLCPAPQLVRNDIGYVDLSTQREALHYTLDEAAGTLRISIHPEALPVTELRLATLAPANLEYATAPSLFVNYALSGSYAVGGLDHETALGFVEGSFSIGHTLAYTSVTASAPGTVVRGLSNIVIDRPDTLRRYTIGDDVALGGLLGGGGVIGGLHLSRDFSIDPYFVAQPTLTQTGVVSAPATVEVYRDGQLIRREVIPAGPFRLQDLTNSASADTQVIVRDPFGAAQMTFTTQILPPAQALKPGLAQYDYSLGFTRRSLAISSFDYGAPAALFVHRLGISNALTIGGRAEGTTDANGRGSVGGSVLLTRGRLNLEATAAASGSDAGVSSAASLALGWRLPQATISGLVREVGRHYSTIDLAPGDERATTEVGALFSWSPVANVSVTTQVGYEHHSSGRDRLHGSLATGFSIADMRATFSTGVVLTDDGQRSFDAMFTLSRSLGQRTTGTTGLVHDGGGDAVIASVAHSVEQNRGVGFAANARLGEQSSGNAELDAEHRYGRATATVDWFAGTARATATIAGGLVLLGGRVKPTRPVTGAFALVRVPGAPGVHTFLDNHLVGTTDGDGDLIVPELQPYYANRLRIDPGDLPMSLATTELDRMVGPPRRGGAIVEFAAPHTAIVSGAVVTRGFDLSFGELVVDDNVRAPIGHEGKFELENVPHGHHTAAAELEDRRCTFTFEVAEGATLVDLRTVRCKLGPGLEMR